MSIIGNIFWLLLGGIVLAFLWAVAGLLVCLTIVGIPFGLQCFKFAGFVLWPFGRDVEFGNFGLGGLLGNIIWILLLGWELCIAHLVVGAFLCLTIIGGRFYEVLHDADACAGDGVHWRLPSPMYITHGWAFISSIFIASKKIVFIRRSTCKLVCLGILLIVILWLCCTERKGAGLSYHGVEVVPLVINVRQWFMIFPIWKNPSHT